MAYYDQSDRIKTLAATLKANGLAMSESEAVRMASEMCTTEDKVQSHSVKSEDSATWNVGKALQSIGRNGRVRPEDAAMIGGVPNPSEQAQQWSPVANFSQPQSHKNQNAKEMIERAENPKPVNVQVNYDTPEFDQNRTVAELIETAESTEEVELPKKEITVTEPEEMPESAPEIEFTRGCREIGTPNTEKGDYNTPIRNDADPTKFAEANVDLSAVFNSSQ